MAYRVIPSALIQVPAAIAKIPAAITSVPSLPIDVPAKSSFAQIITSVPVLLAVQSDLDVTQSGTVSAWGDQSGNGNNLSQAVAGKRPTFTAGALNGYASILFDGSDDVLTSAGPNLPAPGTTNTFMWAVLKQVTWTLNDVLWSANTATSMRLAQTTSTPRMNVANITAGPDNSAGTVGSWFRVEALFSNSVNDFLKVGPTSVTGTNTGNTDPAAGFLLGSNQAGTSFGNLEIVAFMICGGHPTVTEKAALSAAVTAKYGSSVGV